MLKKDPDIHNKINNLLKKVKNEPINEIDCSSEKDEDRTAKDGRRFDQDYIERPTADDELEFIQYYGRICR